MTTATPDKLYIGGQWVEGEGGTFPVLNPSTGETTGEMPEASVADVDRAVESASAAFADGRGRWPSMSAKERSRHLLRYCDVLESHHADLVGMVLDEVGTALPVADFGQVGGAIDYIRYWAERLPSFPFVESLAPTTATPGQVGQAAIFKEPVGVVAAIVPFNFPLLLSAWKLGPALAMGNTVVLKPSPFTPSAAFMLARYAEEADLPPGVLNVVTGDLPAGQRLTTHPGVGMVSFTGSDTVGAQVMAQAAPGLKRVVLELGGKSANIVFADADLDDPGLIGSLLSFTMNAGQGCVLPTRILVEETIQDELVSRLQDALATIRVGNPRDEGVSMGPMIRERQRVRAEGYIASGLSEGAKIAFGGGRPHGLADGGFFLEPTLLTDVGNHMRVAREEIFGPVGVVIKFSGAQEAVSIANDSDFGLGAWLWTRNRRRAYDVGRALQAGTVWINGGGGHGSQEQASLPFGGFKRSGIGREGGDVGAHEYLQIKSMTYPIM